MNHPPLFLSVLMLAGGISVARADVTSHPLFVDHAVLQQGMKVPVWGPARPGEALAGIRFIMAVCWPQRPSSGLLSYGRRRPWPQDKKP
jgi:hypothetical protein